MSLVRFQNGVVIIDSPGVGESEIMDEIVREYLPEAFAFIYVINCTNAGGVQKDRVSLIRNTICNSISSASVIGVSETHRAQRGTFRRKS